MSLLLTLPNELLLLIAKFVLQRPPCICHHPSRHLSAFSRCNRRLHAALTQFLLRSVPASSILLWAIHYSRHDTLALALQQGANPNARISRMRLYSNHLFLGTPIDLASRMLTRSLDADLHSDKLRILALLIRAGGKPQIASIAVAVRRGDLDLVELSLPHFTDIDLPYGIPPVTMLHTAGLLGHIQMVTMLLAAGARVNSVGDTSSAHYYPPLWTMCRAPAPVLQKLLDAGADATWEHNGVSIAAHLRSFGSSRESDISLDLLSRYGSRMPERKKAITLHQAPVWEIWTSQGGSEVVWDQVDECATVSNEYRGWLPRFRGNEWGWMRKSVCTLQPVRCECPECPATWNATYRMVMFKTG